MFCQNIFPSPGHTMTMKARQKSRPAFIGNPLRGYLYGLKRQAKKEEILWQRIVEKTVHQKTAQQTPLLRTAEETVPRAMLKTAPRAVPKTVLIRAMFKAHKIPITCLMRPILPIIAEDKTAGSVRSVSDLWHDTGYGEIKSPKQGWMWRRYAASTPDFFGIYRNQKVSCCLPDKMMIQF